MTGMDIETRLRRVSAAERASRETNASDKETRDAVIFEAEQDHKWTHRRIAEVSGLAISHVQKICYEGTIRAQRAH